MSRPSYQVFNIDLSNPSKLQAIVGEYNYFRMVFAADVSGAFTADAKIMVALGRSSGDPIPVAINGLIEAETDDYQVTWAIQPITVTIITGWNTGQAPNSIHVEAPPAKQLVTTSAGVVIS